ncbi:hypothetical protein BST97_00785 [Nonlabens spongiae]|uniref:DoxX family protein n=1 Tax=Nonlabens spongiae TaxID=331648 RepID=A0A1W6MGD1_9FLAO|nr:DoxX family protein [Nonlabens spongiae]ARN76655.1 hypothetical protein BST97_00785 [Nonlabens spongiae]
MDLIQILEIDLKLINGLDIFNVWHIRRDKASEWRGGNADNMKQEFKDYGLPVATMYAVGVLKCLFLIMLLVSIFITEPMWFETVAGYGIAVLMAGAILMHAYIGDEAKK